jgi:hypothetical protein
MVVPWKDPGSGIQLYYVNTGAFGVIVIILWNIDPAAGQQDDNKQRSRRGICCMPLIPK